MPGDSESNSNMFGSDTLWKMFFLAPTWEEVEG